MEPATAAALINVGSSAANQAGSFLSELFFGDKNQNFAREQATTAYQRQQALLQSQRDYDTPSAQMQRYIDAGLNPNLIYQNENLAPPVPAVGQGDVPAMSNPVTGVDTSSLLQSQLIKAQIRELQNKSDLSEAQAYQIYKITPAQYQKLMSEADRLRQLMDSESFGAAVERLKADMLDGNGNFKFDGVDGELVTDLRSLIMDSAVKQLYANNLDYDSAIKTFYQRIGLINNDLKFKELKNKDLEAFVDVCARIYNAQASQAEFLGSMAEINKSFYGSVGVSDGLAALALKFISLLIMGTK